MTLSNSLETLYAQEHAEVERLRAREAALLAVVRAVAEAGVDDDSSGGTWLMFAGYDAETVREQARALVASDGDGEQGEA